MSSLSNQNMVDLFMHLFKNADIIEIILIWSKFVMSVFTIGEQEI